MEAKPIRYQSRVLELNQLSEAGYELVLDRCGMAFLAGKEIMLHGRETTDDRQYSIASGEADEDLRVLFRLIPDGALTPQLVRWKRGDACEFTGPFGSFLIKDFLRPMVFVASGTGIAPAVSFLRSHAGLDLTVLHGVRTEADLFHRGFLETRASAYHPCVSRQEDTDCFRGRVTARLPELDLPAEAHYYLCGANEMIVETRRMLVERGVGDDAIHAEPYYFW